LARVNLTPQQSHFSSPSWRKERSHKELVLLIDEET